MEYRIEEAAQAGTLANNVNEMIKVGWRPIGGVAVTLDRADTAFYSQALIKDTPQKPR